MDFPINLKHPIFGTCLPISIQSTASPFCGLLLVLPRACLVGRLVASNHEVPKKETNAHRYASMLPSSSSPERNVLKLSLTPRYNGEGSR